MNDSLTRPDVARLKVVHKVNLKNIEKGLVGALFDPLERVLCFTLL